ncbi:hypothetical protein [Nonomuraea turkmeniaca]
MAVPAVAEKHRICGLSEQQRERLLRELAG